MVSERILSLPLRDGLTTLIAVGLKSTPHTCNAGDVGKAIVVVSDTSKGWHDDLLGSSSICVGIFCTCDGAFSPKLGGHQ